MSTLKIKTKGVQCARITNIGMHHTRTTHLDPCGESVAVLVKLLHALAEVHELLVPVIARVGVVVVVMVVVVGENKTTAHSADGRVPGSPCKRI
jgi:hypothetical protein